MRKKLKGRMLRILAALSLVAGMTFFAGMQQAFAGQANYDSGHMFCGVRMYLYDPQGNPIGPQQCFATADNLDVWVVGQGGYWMGVSYRDSGYLTTHGYLEYWSVFPKGCGAVINGHTGQIFSLPSLNGGWNDQISSHDEYGQVAQSCASVRLYKDSQLFGSGQWSTPYQLCGYNQTEHGCTDTNNIGNDQASAIELAYDATLFDHA